jgi:hypothetical protein
LAAAGALQHDKRAIGREFGWSFVTEVVAERDEERVRDRHHALVAALAFCDEQRPIRNAHIRQTKAEDLATAQTTQQHRQHHRPIPLRA